MEYCQDQNGSRLIQQHFEIASDQDRDIIFNLITDVFGNYVIQKTIELGTPKMIDGIFDAIKGRVVIISLNTYGCRVIQKILEVKSIKF